MKTYVETASKDQCLNRIASDAGYLNLLRECARKMNAGDYLSCGNDWANVIVQKWNDEYDVFDAHCFLEVWSKIQLHEIACIPIGPVPQPKSDKDIEFNNGVVSSLAFPFTGEFVGGTGEDDGCISWSEPLNAGPKFRVPILPGVLPLEVGYTTGWTTIRHLFYEKGVARWPYQSERIYLLVRVIEPEISLTPNLRKIFGIAE